MSEEVETGVDISQHEDGQAMGVSFKTIVGSGKDGQELAMSTHVGSNWSDKKINGMLDKISRILERQRVIGEIPFLEEKIKGLKEGIENVIEQTNLVDTKHQIDWEKKNKRGKVVLSESQEAERNNLMINLGRHQEDLEEATKQLNHAKSLRDGEVEQGKAVEQAA